TVSRIAASYELRWAGLLNVIVAILLSESTSNKTRSSVEIVICQAPDGCHSKSIWPQWFCHYRPQACCAEPRQGGPARTAPRVRNRRHELRPAAVGDRVAPHAWSCATSDPLRRS